MKSSMKLSAYFLFIWSLLLFSCKKEKIDNHAPVANAGPDVTINLPVNSAMLTGEGSSDPDNNITSYVWTKISGPFSFNISPLNSDKKWLAQVTNMVEGIYKFELKVTDEGGSYSKDTVQITVIASLPVSNQYPSFYFSGLRWEASSSDNGVKLIVPQVPNRNASDVTGVAAVDQANCDGPWGICYYSDFQYIAKDGTQPGVIYYRIENGSVVLYIKSQPFNSYYQSAQYAVVIDF